MAVPNGFPAHGMSQTELDGVPRHLYGCTDAQRVSRQAAAAAMLYSWPLYGDVDVFWI